ncbi:hypothetical protein [Enterococcus sp. DIV0876]|uniref:hypothetical protein n=1 Tax=Enterococcus sp. DIV0876 TaxID=2774633 RepID=UPI003D2FE9CD
MRDYNMLNEIKHYFLNLEENEDTVFLVSYCDNDQRATVWQTQAATCDKAWTKVSRYLTKFPIQPKWIKIDKITNKTSVPKEIALRQIKGIDRNNYFADGVEMGAVHPLYIMPEELTANALFVPHKNHILGKNRAQMSPNERNIISYIQKRLKRKVLDSGNHIGNNWTLFKKKGVFIEGENWYALETDFFGQGVRAIDQSNQFEHLEQAIVSGSNYLSQQLNADGSFVYGYFPAYHKKISGYNSVRHFSSLYALLEAYEYRQDPDLIEKIETGLRWGIENLTINVNNQLFVVEKTKQGNELKLGAQAMIILALSKYEEVTKDRFYHQVLLNFLEGIQAFIHDNGETCHILTDTLAQKEKFRIIYYDGEALFAIMRAYPLTGDKKWLDLGEKLMERFIRNGYEKYHDHWLSYSVNELTKYLPKRAYFAFGLKNALDNLRFIERRDTAYPTMLELLVAAVKMVERMESIEACQGMITEKEKEELQRVMEKRTIHELRTGTMWPELAMYFAKPTTIVGGFYTRHDRCRMRIDDAEHFLSGMINYMNVHKGVKKDGTMDREIAATAI